jgi:serine/threonine protein kinase
VGSSRCLRASGPPDLAIKPMSGPSAPDRVYHLEEKISEGSFGLIWRVLDASTNVRLVAKIFEEEEWTTLSDDEEESTMSSTALRELSFMQLLTRLNTPHATKVLDFGFELGEYFALIIYMPLYTGDLCDAICDKRLDAQQRLRIAGDVLRALAFMHGSTPAIAHRDLKPENVLLDNDARGFLTDFSFACFTGEYRQGTRSPRRRTCCSRSSSTSSSEVDSNHSGLLGTVTYLAPEVLEGSFPHPSADVWAAGVLLLELLDNERLDADTDEEALKLLRWRRGRLRGGSLIQSVLSGFLEEDPLKRSTIPGSLALLEAAGVLHEERTEVPLPRFSSTVGPAVSVVIEDLCEVLGAVVPETRLAAQVYWQELPDVGPSVSAIVACKVHEHRPHSDDRMTRSLRVDMDALEEGQEKLLKHFGGCLLAQELLRQIPGTS